MQALQRAQASTVLQAEMSLEVSEERADGTVFPAALPSASLNRIPTARLTSRQQVIADLRMPVVPVVEDKNATTQHLYQQRQ